MNTALFKLGAISQDPPSNGFWNKQAMLVFMLSLATLFSFLGTPGLKEPDEGRYAEIAREMAASNNWLIPHLDGFEHFQKPPLLYWATALSLKLFGINEWAARLPAALSALGVVLLTFWIGSWLFGSRTGLLATLVILSSFEFFALSRTLNTDMALTFWTTATTAFFLRWTITPEARRWEWLYFASMGMAFLTKGPIALLVPLSVVLLVHIHARSIDAPLPIYWLRGTFVTLVISLFWFVAVVAIHPELVRYFLGFELFQRTIGAARGREQPFWFYFLVLSIGLFPWSLFVPFAFVSRGKSWSLNKIQRVDLALYAWILVPSIVLTIVRSKLPTYVLPLFPAFALLIADWIGSQTSPRTVRRVVFITTMIFLALLGLPLLLPYISHQTRNIKPHAVFMVSEVIVILATAGAVLLAARWQDPLRLVSVLGGGSILAWIVAFALLDTLDKDFGEQASVRRIATLLKSAPDLANSQIFCIGTRAHGIEFYTGRLVFESIDKADLALQPAADQKVRLIEDDDAWEKNLSPNTPIYVVTTRKKLAKLSRKWDQLGCSGNYVLLKPKASAP